MLSDKERCQIRRDDYVDEDGQRRNRFIRKPDDR